MTTTINDSARIVRMNQLQAFVGLSKSTIRELINSDDFPKQVHLTRRAVGWLVTDVDAWVRRRAEGSQTKGRPDAAAIGQPIGLEQEAK